MQNNSSQNHFELNNLPMMQPPNQIHIWYTGPIWIQKWIYGQDSRNEGYNQRFMNQHSIGPKFPTAPTTISENDNDDGMVGLKNKK